MHFRTVPFPPVISSVCLVEILLLLNDRKMSVSKNAGVVSYGSYITDVVWHVSAVIKRGLH